MRPRSSTGQMCTCNETCDLLQSIAGISSSQGGWEYNFRENLCLKWQFGHFGEKGGVMRGVVKLQNADTSGQRLSEFFSLL